MAISGQFHLWCPIVVGALLDGLGAGLSRFSGPSRVALLLQVHPASPIYVYDRHDLLKGNEKYLTEYYALPESLWRSGNTGIAKLSSRRGRFVDHSAYVVPRPDAPVSFYTRIFTDDHTPASVTGPTQRWLAEAARVLFQELIKLAHGEAMVQVAFQRTIEGYATYAAGDFVRILLNSFPQLTRPRLGWEDKIIACIAGISMGVEEGYDPMGRLAFVQRLGNAEAFMAARFQPDQAPTLASHKHIRKLLRLTDGFQRTLIAHGDRIVGIAAGPLPSYAVVAEFRGRRGEVRVGETPVCTFSRGQFYSFTLAPDLRRLTIALRAPRWRGHNTKSLSKAVANIAKALIDGGHGCTIVVASHVSATVAVSGHKLQRPLDLTQDEDLSLAIAMAAVDGALYISADASLRAFGCILDGASSGGEDLSRGSRYNSALRFCQSNPGVVVVVVSEDGPVTVFSTDLSSAHPVVLEQAGHMLTPMTLDEWARR